MPSFGAKKVWVVGMHGGRPEEVYERDLKKILQSGTRRRATEEETRPVWIKNEAGRSVHVPCNDPALDWVDDEDNVRWRRLTPPEIQTALKAQDKQNAETKARIAAVEAEKLNRARAKLGLDPLHERSDA